MSCYLTDYNIISQITGHNIHILGFLPQLTTGTLKIVKTTHHSNFY